MSATTTTCRVCGSAAAVQAGVVEFYAGFQWVVWDCASCGCRTTRHDESVYETLHADAGSSYSRYRELASACAKQFAERDADGLRSVLSSHAKYRFVIDEISRLGTGGRILEIGCARGFLTACFVLDGLDVTGVDVSPEAISAAREAFGDHFAVAGSAELASRGPYDVIYHVGTIGCVADPLGLTRQLLQMLKPGGILLFNAPNRDALWSCDQLWFESAPPPDVVTLFPPGFWRSHFSCLATVEETCGTRPPEQSLALRLRRLCGRGWRRPAPLPVHESHRPFAPAPRPGDGVWRIFERLVVKTARFTGLSRLVPPLAAEYDLFVKMTVAGPVSAMSA